MTLTYVISLALLVAATSGGVLLRRYLISRRLQRQLASVRLTTELWRQINLLPANLVSRPVRDAVATVFATTATLLTGSPFASMVENLRSQANQIRLRRPAPAATLLPANIGRLFEKVEQQLARASALNLLSARDYALANSAIVLARELAGVDILVQESQVAAVLKDHERSEQLRAQALARCARLPAKTAEEVRRRVQASAA